MEMPSNVEAPEGWTEVETAFGQQIAAYQRRRDGLVLSVERGTTSDKYAVSALPQNFHEDNQPIRSVGDSGYLYSGDSESEAFEAAETHMEENER